MTPNIIQAFLRFNQRIENLFNSKNGLLIICLYIFIGFSLLYFPEIFIKRFTNSWSNQDQTIQHFINEKINHPLTALQNVDDGDHIRKRELRITPYLLGKMLNLEAIKLFYIQSTIFLFIFIGLCLKNLQKLTQDAGMAFWGTLAILGSYVGHSFSFDTFFFDSFAYLGLLFAFYFRKHWMLIPILLITYFVDERSVVPSTVLFMTQPLERPFQSNSFNQIFQHTILKNRIFWNILVAILLYCLIRIFLYFIFNLSTPTGSGSGVQLFTAFRYQFKLPLAIFSAFKLNYLFLVWVGVFLFRTQHWVLSSAYFIQFSLLFLISTAVEDVTRSLAYGFPMIFIYFLCIPKLSAEKQQASIWIALIAIFNLLFPTYSLLLQLYPIPSLHIMDLFR